MRLFVKPMTALYKPELLVIAGPNGSGKTTLTMEVIEHRWGKGCHFINPDNIAKEQFGDWNSHTAVLQAAELAEQLREDYLTKGESMAFETVFSAQDKVEFIRRAQAKDYFIRVFFVGTESPLINSARVAQRVMNGGHDVPIRKIIDRYYKSVANMVRVLPMVDRLYVYDNSVDEQTPQAVFRTVNGIIQKRYMETMPVWVSEALRTAQSAPACAVNTEKRAGLASPQP